MLEKLSITSYIHNSKIVEKRVHYILQLEFIMWLRWTTNTQSSCPTNLNVEITGMCHAIWLKYLSNITFSVFLSLTQLFQNF